MPTYRLKCNQCGNEWDRMCTVSKRNDQSECCGSSVEQLYVPNGFMTFQDDIPGGVVLENLGPVPVKVYSYTERRNLMKQRGLVEMVRHTGVPGTDKSPHTISWECPPLSDPRPIAALPIGERRARREESATRLGLTVEELEAISGPVHLFNNVTLAETEQQEREGDTEFTSRVIRPFNMTGQGDDVKEIVEIIEALDGQNK